MSDRQEPTCDTCGEPVIVQGAGSGMWTEHDADGSYHRCQEGKKFDCPICTEPLVIDADQSSLNRENGAKHSCRETFERLRELVVHVTAQHVAEIKTRLAAVEELKKLREELSEMTEAFDSVSDEAQDFLRWRQKMWRALRVPDDLPSPDACIRWLMVREKARLAIHFALAKQPEAQDRRERHRLRGS